MYSAPRLWNALDLNMRLLPFHYFKKEAKTSLSEVLCKLILVNYRFIVSHEESIYIYIYIYIYNSYFNVRFILF